MTSHSMENKLVNQVCVWASSILVKNDRELQIQLTETAKEKPMPLATIKSKGKLTSGTVWSRALREVTWAVFSLHLLTKPTATHLYTGSINQPNGNQSILAFTLRNPSPMEGEKSELLAKASQVSLWLNRPLSHQPWTNLWVRDTVGSAEAGMNYKLASVRSMQTHELKTGLFKGNSADFTWRRVYGIWAGTAKDEQ